MLVIVLYNTLIFVIIGNSYGNRLFPSRTQFPPRRIQEPLTGQGSGFGVKVIVLKKLHVHKSWVKIVGRRINML